MPVKGLSSMVPKVYAVHASVHTEKEREWRGSRDTRSASERTYVHACVHMRAFGRLERARGKVWGSPLERLWKGSGEPLGELWRGSGEPLERRKGSGEPLESLWRGFGYPLGEALERLCKGLSRRVSGGVLGGLFEALCGHQNVPKT